MCRFISIAVENVKEAERIFADYNVWKNDNKSFDSEIPSKHNALWITDGQCSCNFYSDPYNPKKEERKFRKKFSKKGWPSERKDKEVRKNLNKLKHEGGLNSELYSCIQNYTNNVGDCYLHIGWYDGDQTIENINIIEHTEISSNSTFFDSNNIIENVLYRFTNKAHDNSL